jgi:outer membrane biosynthesis protein TonB
MLLLSLAAPTCLAAPHAAAIAPLKPGSVSQYASSRKGDIIASVLGQKKFASVAAAAISTEDLATISFTEYEVDWSAWVEKMTDRWTDAMNRPAVTSGLKPSGPLFVEFTCKKDGTISEVMIDHSSGDRSCDAISIGTLLRCLPLPSFPAESRKKSITVLCIWAYNSHVPVSKASKRHNDKQPTRISISGAQL